MHQCDFGADTGVTPPTKMYRCTNCAPVLSLASRRGRGAQAGVAKTTRSGYSSGAGKPVEILKRKSFAKWQAGEELSDADLAKALQSGVLLEVHCGKQDH